MSTPPPQQTAPARRFKPEPIETTRTSSKKDDAPAPRKFNVQPIETTTSSSRNSDSTSKQSPAPRRFTPQLVGTSRTSSRGESGHSGTNGPRRFVPQVVETSEKSSKDRKSSQPRRFVPDLVETTHSSTRSSDTRSNTSDGPRRFAPILIDTASRSRRTNQGAGRQSSRTEEGFALHAREHRRHITGTETPQIMDHDQDNNDIVCGNESTLAPPQFSLSAELRRQIAPMDGSRSRAIRGNSRQRTHSFRLPDLDTIESSESSEGESSPSSTSNSPNRASPLTASDTSINAMNHATRKRESVDESYMRYILELEAKKARQRMQEEALLAAFPNSDFHEPVQHYMNNEDSDDMEFEVEDRPVTYGPDDDTAPPSRHHAPSKLRRESTMPWEQLEMQRHAELMQQENNANRITRKKPTEDESLWWKSDLVYGLEPVADEMRSMLNRAKPPMLGNSIEFPRCQSPEPARFDVTQGSAATRSQMCYLTQEASRDRSDDGRLWHGTGGMAETAAKQPAGLFQSPAPSASPPKGLWGGFCVVDGSKTSTLAPPVGPTGIMTPRAESGSDSRNPFEQAFGSPGDKTNHSPETIVIRTPPTPKSIGRGEMAHIDGMLVEHQELGQAIAEQFPDSFVTQVYNYLSLGYPSLARPFDMELSKITHVSIADLRSDDSKAKQMPKGYIRLGPDFEGGGGQGLVEQDCVRWKALRLYIHEWARQEKNMVNTDGPLGDWGLGAGARRGSWAI